MGEDGGRGSAESQPDTDPQPVVGNRATDKVDSGTSQPTTTTDVPKDSEEEAAAWVREGVVNRVATLVPANLMKTPLLRDIVREHVKEKCSDLDLRRLFEEQIDHLAQRLAKKGWWQPILYSAVAAGGLALGGWWFSQIIAEAQGRSDERIAAAQRSLEERLAEKDREIQDARAKADRDMQEAHAESEQRLREGELVATYLDMLLSTDQQRRSLAISTILLAMPARGPTILEAISADSSAADSGQAAQTLDRRLGVLVSGLFTTTDESRVAFRQLADGWSGSTDALQQIIAAGMRQTAPSRGLFNALRFICHADRSVVAASYDAVRRFKDRAAEGLVADAETADVLNCVTKSLAEALAIGGAGKTSGAP
jgi:hypothetical protein